MNADTITALVNKIRGQSNLEPLTTSDQLTDSAKERANHLCKTGNWSHDGWKEVIQSHYQYESAGENLAKNYKSASGTVKAWVNSPSHYKVMTLGFSDTGVAVKECGANTYIVQHFGTPQVITTNNTIPSIGIGVAICLTLVILSLILMSALMVRLRPMSVNMRW